ncbi:MAG TPA: hypothetical protein VFQ07_06505, partial [Candidatus Polarisedimenticolia bacterium]|nr:hypothetical protein [Candidatus Polarisedimenticolia bacterium]
QPAVTFPCSDDGNACTDEVCSQGSCTHPSKPDGTSCGDACSNGTCQVGACVAGTPPSCDDFNPCTVDSCDPVAGCQHTPLNCDDGNACTRDLCSTTTGQCTHDPENNIPCPGPGADACHAAYCVQGACTGLAPVSCDDGKVCTVDSCDVNQGGCVHRDGACDDGNTCTVDNCSASGACQHIPYPAGFPCSDGNACTTNDLCTGPAGAPVCVGIGPSCDDGNSCTTDVGVVEGATCLCDHLPVESACCSGGGPRSCDDANSCTADRCVPDVGCVHDPVEHRVSCGVGACERTVDTCAPPGAICVPGTPAPETCNNRVDEDCDGLVDERETLPGCAVRPLVIRDGGTLQAFSVACRWSPICAGAPAPIPLDAIGTVWLSAADLLSSAADNEALPDPFAHCGEAIVENPARRMTTDAAVTFVFDPKGDGVCGTSGGGRPGLVKALADVPDGKLARVCVKWRNVALVETERCGIVLVKHDASAEPQPVQNPVPDESRAAPEP